MSPENARAMLYEQRTRQWRRAKAFAVKALFWNFIGWLVAAASWMVHIEPFQVALPELYQITRDPRATILVVVTSLVCFAAGVHLFARERGE